MSRRVFLIVLDSFGIGYEPDADQFGDVGSNTLATIRKSPCYATPNMEKLGLFCIDGVARGNVTNMEGAYGRLREKSKGKDTTAGHWELAGYISQKPFPVYPDGFPEEVLTPFIQQTGRGILCNRPYSGTEVIKTYGREHEETGKLIVYTSADSVFQIAAHEDIVAVETLYEYCKIARNILQGEHGVGRVIARPFAGTWPEYYRTPNRHDFSLTPPADTMLDVLKAAGYDTISIGKINDIFAGKGITESHPTKGNEDGMNRLMEMADRNFHGLCFANLVDFDMVYGHRNDVDGYAKAATAFDQWLSGFMPKLRQDDVLIITADHGCDPGFKGTDHTREYVPVLFYGNQVQPNSNLGTRETFADLGATVLDLFGLSAEIPGVSMKDKFWIQET